MAADTGRRRVPEINNKGSLSLHGWYNGSVCTIVMLLVGILGWYSEVLVCSRFFMSVFQDEGYFELRGFRS